MWQWRKLREAVVVVAVAAVASAMVKEGFHIAIAKDYAPEPPRLLG